MIELDSEKFILHLQQSLKFVRPNRLRTAVIVRCPYCGDSQKSFNKGHLNIKIDDPRCFLWRCARCGEGGIVNYKFLKDLECYDPELIEMGLANSLNSRNYHKNKPTFSLNNVFKKYKFINEITDTELSEEKLDYVSNRLNIEITPKLAKKLKIVTDFYKFLDNNELEITESNNMIDYIQKNAVGFLSWDNSMIIFRNIHGMFFGDKRYFNYNIYRKGNLDNSNKFYSLPKKIDIMSPVIKINLAEGIFDILGLAFTELKDEIKEENSLMISCNGQSYANILNLIKNMGFINMEVRFFSDKDVNKNKFINLKNSIDILKYNECRLFYNKNGKDYGDLNQGIELEEVRI